jgi:hypothetical protein
MTVTERVMALGSWSLRLSPDCPYDIRAGVVPFSSIIILPQWLPAGGLSDTQMMASARYHGVVRRPGPQFEIGGTGLALYLGDEEGKGAVWATAQTGVGFSLASWVSGIITTAVNGWVPPLFVGTVTAPGSPATITTTAPRGWSRRATLDSICNLFGVEWRVNSNKTLDVAHPDTLYGATASTVIARNYEGRDVTGLTGLRGQLGVSVDYEDWATRVDVLGRSGWGSSGGASATIRDADGQLITWIRPVESPETILGNEATLAASLLSLYSGVTRTVTLAADEYDVEGLVQVGARVAVYDPELGLLDSSNPVHFGGQQIYPVSLRLYGATWPVRQGMGVYCRVHGASAPAVYTDLTPWIVWESGSATLEVGAPGRSIGVLGTPLQASPIRAEQLSAAWDIYTPSFNGLTLGNGTVSAAYRREGTLLHVHGRVTLGSTSSVTGIVQVSLPAGMVSPGNGRYQMGHGQLWDNSTAITRPITCRIGSATSFYEFTYWAENALGSVGAFPVTSGGAPITFATSDYIEWSLTCEVDP